MLFFRGENEGEWGEGGGMNLCDQGGRKADHIVPRPLRSVMAGRGGGGRETARQSPVFPVSREEHKGTLIYTRGGGGAKLTLSKIGTQMWDTLDALASWSAATLPLPVSRWSALAEMACPLPTDVRRMLSSGCCCCCCCCSSSSSSSS